MHIIDGGRVLLATNVFPIRDPTLRQRVYSVIRAQKLLDIQVAYVLLMPDLSVLLKTQDSIDGRQRGRPVNEVELADHLVEVSNLFLNFW
jgi:hypothetical protein